MRLEKIIDEHEFIKNHQHQVDRKSQKDVFFIWMVIVLLSVIAAHFVLNLTGSSPTAYVTATQSFDSNAFLLLGGLMVSFIVVLIVGLVYTGISKKDY